MQTLIRQPCERVFKAFAITQLDSDWIHRCSCYHRTDQVGPEPAHRSLPATAGCTKSSGCPGSKEGFFCCGCCCCCCTGKEMVFPEDEPAFSLSSCAETSQLPVRLAQVSEVVRSMTCNHFRWATCSAQDFVKLCPRALSLGPFFFSPWSQGGSPVSQWHSTKF